MRILRGGGRGRRWRRKCRGGGGRGNRMLRGIEREGELNEGVLGGGVRAF